MQVHKIARVSPFVLSVWSALLLASSALAQSKEPCGPEIKYEFAKLLANDPSQTDPLSPAALAFQKDLYDKYSFCAPDPNQKVIVDRREFCSGISLVGNLSYERMPCCGYDPQKGLFACPIRIERPDGFGAPFSGSYEHVLTCVDFGYGFEPVALDSVHLSDAVSRAAPWQFAVIAEARKRLLSLPLKGQTLKARSILSWATVPTSCDYQSYWGHGLDYQIRLDP